ncbi:MAG: PilZ domain-containing protein [Candidatus Omnitrophica bacterium]|nr:PilZ domain-containing protein [Candidatus Omnitrophota bacterium]
MWSGINKRKFPRANYPCIISVKRKDHDDTVSAKTENIGIGGICVMLPKDMGIFAPVEIQLDLLDNQPLIKCDGAIVWVVAKKTDNNKLYDTGLEFTNMARKDAMRINEVVEKILGKN